MKRKILMIAMIVVLSSFTSVVFISCETEDNEGLGEKAAVEFCDCLDDGNTAKECEKKLKSKYREAVYTSDDFIEGFNREGKACGAYAEYN